MKIRTSLIGVLLCLFAQPVLSDPIITYTMDDLGGGQYQYNYTIDNTAGAFAIEEFSIFFEFSLYENLNASASPADWDPIVIQPDTGLPDDGFVDWLALGLVLDPGEILSGFSVVFDWIGLEGPPPLDQYFAIIDPFTFDTLADGMTMFVDDGNGNDVPEPGTLGLFAMALLLSGFASRKRILVHQ